MKKKKAAEKSAAGDYAQPLGEGFEEYRRLHEQGYSKEEATRKSVSKIPLAILSNKADDYIGKNSKVDENASFHVEVLLSGADFIIRELCRIVNIFEVKNPRPDPVICARNEFS